MVRPARPLRLRWPGGFCHRYQHLQTRDKNPLCKMQALGVLMNKLLRILWTLMRKHTLYVPDFQPTI